MKASEIKIGDEIIIEDYHRPRAVVKVVKTTKTQVTVEHPEKQNEILRYKEDRYDRNRFEVIGQRGHNGFHSTSWAYTYLRLPQKDENLEEVKKDIKTKREQEAATQKEQKEKEKKEQEKREKEYQEKVDGYWMYEGRKKWEEAEEIKTQAGTAKIINYNNKYDGNVTAFVLVRKEKEQFVFKGEPKDQFVANIAGFRYNNGYMHSFSSSEMKAYTEKELIYRIVH